MQHTEIILATVQHIIIGYLAFRIYKLEQKVKDTQDNSCYSSRKNIPEFTEKEVEKILAQVDKSIRKDLEYQLQTAIEDNNFEEAARLRDVIKNINR